ncbi:hypothetical protein BDV38DRAFT_284109 [Aspergillus pseudotamarii]|uniref:Uncharacterized protein n=1 Tax=Aspergillus pseudotamarii TaxID=132259 RepID=A0A5N6SNU7_ASPPS|nr:uncharacterized protein BDV38DRAFT_284109 [Aspergillus pseudotamarii]KAE8136362.1 hypothetical protein BDV38DRAFT_284109 [Aspergillus pseudotamarii]
MSQAKKALDAVKKLMTMLDFAGNNWSIEGYQKAFINNLVGLQNQMQEVHDNVKLLKPDSNQEASADGRIEKSYPDEMNELVRGIFYLCRDLAVSFQALADYAAPEGSLSSKPYLAL